MHYEGGFQLICKNVVIIIIIIIIIIITITINTLFEIGKKIYIALQKNYSLIYTN